MKELKIPEGYVVDLEKTTATKIVLKIDENIKTYQDLIDRKKRIKECYGINRYSNLRKYEDIECSEFTEARYADAQVADKARAMGTISQLMPFMEARLLTKNGIIDQLQNTLSVEYVIK